jgi:CrcB protein
VRRLALVLVGGFFGTLARYYLQVPLRSAALGLLPDASHIFPYDVFLINLSGALLLGLLYGLFERGAALPPDARLAIGTGFLGAYTTFSSFAYGGVGLLEHGDVQTALVYLCGSMALGVFAARAGESLASAIVERRRLIARGRVHLRRLWQVAGASAQEARLAPVDWLRVALHQQDSEDVTSDDHSSTGSRVP